MKVTNIERQIFSHDTIIYFGCEFPTEDCGECTSARSQSDCCIQSKTTWLMFIHPKFVYKQKNFPKFQSVFFFKNTPKYDKLSKISNISIKTMLELRTKFGNFGNFGHISDGLRKQSSVRTQCCNLIGSEPLYIPCSGMSTFLCFEQVFLCKSKHGSQTVSY